MATSYTSGRTGGPGFAAGQHTNEQASKEDTSGVPAACEAVGEMVRNYPASSTLVTLGLGFGLGVLLGTALGRPPKQKGAMARFGESVWNTMSSVVPDSMKR